MLIDSDDRGAFVVFDLVDRDAPNNAVTQRFDDLARLDNRLDPNAFCCSAIRLRDDDVLGDIDQSTSQVARVGGFQRRIGQTLAGTVSGDEVL